MLAWVLQFSLLSLILIFLVHHLFTFFKDTLTIPKTKDLVNTPTRKYETMFQVMGNGANNIINVTSSSLDAEDMKNELKNYLKAQVQTQDKAQTQGQSQEYLQTNVNEEYKNYQDTTANIGYYNTTYITELGTPVTAL
jgi:cell shape-determining protein MreC